ncbi:rhodanese-like domain-containing protein [Telmatospirillum siberiense]|nr:rhodanese-like domain-containing protein [Telmatospirillum siberiense]
MPRPFQPEDLRRRWRDGSEIALFDVREEGPYADAHPLFAISLPLTRIESDIFDLVPRRNAPIVLYDDGEGLAERARSLIEGLGYSDVTILEGGLRGYERRGELYRDVNVPSKAFGELVESIRHTPSLAASEVKALLDGGADMAILDSRRFEEYRTMSIPGGISVPGGELVLRAGDAAPSPDTLVIVNCAGRTRSIIGTQSLINAGLPNRVAALRNGTIGWTLAGFPLDRGRTESFPPTSETARAGARAAAARWAERVGVRVISRAWLRDWLTESNRHTLYRLDVRTPEEYAAGHPRGFRSAPGGQLVQATDEWVAVRGARIVLFDDDGVRARMTASWLVQMGWQAVVLEEGALPCDETGTPARQRPPIPPGRPPLSPADLDRWGPEACVLDLARSPEYAAGHIPGARFVLRSRFAADLPDLPGAGPIVLTSPDGAAAAYAAEEAARHTRRPVHFLTGGTKAWSDAGFPLEHEAHHWLSPAIDVYKRPYEGTDNAADAMQAYIDWELQLVAQLANDGVSNFHVVRPEAP